MEDNQPKESIFEAPSSLQNLDAISAWFKSPEGIAEQEAKYLKSADINTAILSLGYINPEKLNTPFYINE